MDVRVGLWRNLSAEELILLKCGVARRSNQSILKEISPGCSLEGLMLKLKLQYFGHLMRRLTHWKRLGCWEGLGAGGEGDDRGWDGWMTSPTRWTWVWVNSGSWWWTGRPGVLRFLESQRVGHYWATELNCYVYVSVKVKVAQSCPTLCDPVDCSPWNSADRMLEWVTFPFSRGSSQPRDQTQVSCIAGRFFTTWATREAQEYWSG